MEEWTLASRLRYLIPSATQCPTWTLLQAGQFERRLPEEILKKTDFPDTYIQIVVFVGEPFLAKPAICNSVGKPSDLCCETVINCYWCLRVKLLKTNGLKSWYFESWFRSTFAEESTNNLQTLDIWLLLCGLKNIPLAAIKDTVTTRTWMKHDIEMITLDLVIASTFVHKS